MKILAAIILVVSLIGITGCYDYDIHNGGVYHPYWYNHGWYGGNRFDDHRGPAFGHEFNSGHFAGHENGHYEENHNDHHENNRNHSGH